MGEILKHDSKSHFYLNYLYIDTNNDGSTDTSTEVDPVELLREHYKIIVGDVIPSPTEETTKIQEEDDWFVPVGIVLSFFIILCLIMITIFFVRRIQESQDVRLVMGNRKDDEIFQDDTVATISYTDKIPIS